MRFPRIRARRDPLIKCNASSRERARYTRDEQRSRPGTCYSGQGIGGGPDREHAEVHERESSADQRQAPQLRDVEHLRDRGDVEEVVRPGRDRQERALRARVLPRGGRGLELVVHAARRVRRPGRRRGHDRISGAAGGDPTRAPQERRGDRDGPHGPPGRQPRLPPGPRRVSHEGQEEVAGPPADEAQSLAHVRLEGDLPHGGMTMVTETQHLVEPGKANELGYKTFRLGQFTFERNAYFCVLHYPGGEYHMPVGEFLRAVQRDIGWNFFYGLVKFDQVFGTFNFYDNGVDMFLGKYTDAWQMSGKAYSEMLPNEEVSAEYKERFGLLNLYDYLARNDVTWNPEIVSAVEYSLFCPTTEEYILPITHGNDRVEWFLLLNGQISMEIRDRDTGNLRAYMHMKPGDCCAMPADISHNLWAPERSMLLVWENGNPELPELIRLGKTPTTPLQEFGLS